MVYVESIIFMMSLAISVIMLGIAIWKKSGLLLMVGALIFLCIPVFVDGIQVTGVSSVSTTTTTAVSYFEDDYDVNTGWTQVGAGVTVDSGTADKVHYALSSATTDIRVWKDTGVLINSDDLFTAEFDFNVDISTTTSQVFLWHLTANSDAPDQSNDGLGVYYRISTNDGINIAYKDDSGGVGQCQTPTVVADDTTYFVRFSRTSPTIAVLDVFTNEERTTRLTGFPHVCAIPEGITGLRYLQHGQNDASSTNAFTAVLDNTNIEGQDLEQIVEETDFREVEFPVVIRFLAAMGGISLLAFGVSRFGFRL